MYLSEDGGESWTLVLQATAPFNVVFAPDDPQLVYAVGTQFKTTYSSAGILGSSAGILGSSAGILGSSAGILGISRNAGQTWTTRSLGSSLWHVAVAPLEANGTRRRVYAVGENAIWYSSDGGQAWASDGGVATIDTTRQQLSEFQQTCEPPASVGSFGGKTRYAAGNAPQILAVEPGNPSRVYLATVEGANGPTYYSTMVKDGTPVNTDCRRLAGEASLWLGDFGQFESSGSAQWSLLPGPPVYTGETSPSGNCFVATQPTAAGFLLFFSDNSHVHMSAGTPVYDASWHRLDGMDASEAHAIGETHNVLFVHADPHAIAFTRDFEITLKAPSSVNDLYAKNSELDEHIAGTVWMANDGGVYRCDDGGKDESSWRLGTGLETVDPVNIAGLAGIGGAPALYFGCGDNNDFFTRDGGAHWGNPGSECGDCDAWFSDPAQMGRVIQFLPRRGASDFTGWIGIITSSGLEYPNAEDDGSKTFVPSPKKQDFLKPAKLSPYAASDVYLIGYRPLIQTLSTEAPLPDGDVVIIEQALDGTADLFRTTSISSIKTMGDWHDASKAQQIGPTLPPGAIAVQASGGHASPVYYVGSRNAVWRLSQDETQWSMIVPSSVVGSPSVTYAHRWFVDPYDPEEIYVLDPQGMKISIDGGNTWIFDQGMTNAVTCGGKLKISPSLLQDMQFSRAEPQTRFAMGTAGVLCTFDYGVSWLSALNSIALPGRPESGFFDPISDQTDRAIYVACEGRSILRVGGLPEPPPLQPESFDLMELAALDY